MRHPHVTQQTGSRTNAASSLVTVVPPLSALRTEAFRKSSRLHFNNRLQSWQKCVRFQTLSRMCYIRNPPPPPPNHTHTRKRPSFSVIKKKYRSKLLCYKLQDCKGLMSLLSPQRGGDNRADSSSISLLKKCLMHLNI